MSSSNKKTLGLLLKIQGPRRIRFLSRKSLRQIDHAPARRAVCRVDQLVARVAHMHVYIHWANTRGPAVVLRSKPQCLLTKYVILCPLECQKF